MKTTSFSTPSSTSTASSKAAQISAEPDRQRALVLGGGSTGNAWLIGMIAGLFDAGIDLTEADLIAGTSAGSTAAAQITGVSPSQLFASILSAATPQQSAPVAAKPEQGPPGVFSSVPDHMRRTSEVIAAAHDVADMRRQMGASALALAASSDAPTQSRWRATVAARLPQQQWPAQRVLITAVDADTGEPVAFDSHSGVDLADAVAASCAGGFAYRIGNTRFIDGGYRTNAENADLATGYARVLVLSPFGGRSRTPVEWGMHLATQIEELRVGGSGVETIYPDSQSEHMFGTNAMNLSLRPAAAQAGYEQAQVLAKSIEGFWR
ncbi:conserved hypothetical protein [Renibacterium salmoninarum ATCC 33209]|uniref:PNPLA domain-containing protein n=1 Tax=Renibacterium salmoninarum (strain ATCC 33209 / DSM 20767 / JCM 11484 / NBRC 15589 / NCIMB 2235) TaxID=288705 RepID=A9WMC6_RENSM|nr:patatin-like phospholipase family protein [Renibacterium salmoninarum]ABY22055.1 conserved hypothetical protein [Renibacterium salmoninarum ATCC 33209]